VNERRLTEKRLGSINRAVDNDHGIYRDQNLTLDTAIPARGASTAIGGYVGRLSPLSVKFAGIRQKAMFF
jgi:hypothetical protein